MTLTQYTDPQGGQSRGLRHVISLPTVDISTLHIHTLLMQHVFTWKADSLYFSMCML